MRLVGSLEPGGEAAVVVYANDPDLLDVRWTGLLVWPRFGGTSTGRHPPSGADAQRLVAEEQAAGPRCLPLAPLLWRWEYEVTAGGWRTWGEPAAPGACPGVDVDAPRRTLGAM